MQTLYLNEEIEEYSFNLDDIHLEIDFIEEGKFCNISAEFDENFVCFEKDKFISKELNDNPYICKEFKIFDGISVYMYTIYNKEYIAYGRGIFDSWPIKSDKKIKLFLNKNKKYSLNIETITGNVNIKNGNFTTINIKTLYGNVNISNCFIENNVNNTIIVKDGNIDLDHVHGIKNIFQGSSVGQNIRINNCYFNNLVLKTNASFNTRIRESIFDGDCYIEAYREPLIEEIKEQGNLKIKYKRKAW